jgi:tetratricopeptide (TPR) repeat protein
VVNRRERIQALATLRRVSAGPRTARSKALHTVDLALKAHPNEPDLLLLKGHLLERLGEYQEARRLYARVMRCNGANVLAAMDMGHSYYYAGRLSLALRWYDHALELLQAGHCWAVWRAEWEEAHWFRAWALAELGRTKAAVLCCRHGLAKAPRSHPLRDLLTRFQEGDPDTPGPRRR